MRAPIHSPVNTRQIERKTAQHHKDTTKKLEKRFCMGSDMKCKKVRSCVKNEVINNKNRNGDNDDDDDYHWLEVH